MRTKRKRLEQDGASAGRGSGLPYAGSVLAPRTKWRAIVRPGAREAEETERVPAEQADAHNAIVSNLFRGGSEQDGEEYPRVNGVIPAERRVGTW